MLQKLDEPISTLEICNVRSYSPFQRLILFSHRLLQKVPHPFIGPEGFRSLLVFRGITGFIGLNGTCFSLQYLSLSDITVLSFLVPMCTSVSGSLSLKEALTKREALAGHEWSSLCSLFEVVLIARPDFLFGSPNGSTAVEEKHRMLAIGIALPGVLGTTGVMTTIRAIGQRAHPVHLLAFFSLQSVIAASSCKPWFLFNQEPVEFQRSMAILREPVIIPTRLAWLGL
ncbi:hypothetical protein B0H19DRAFT_1302918 [Mycena capillaripes]|nr:hypothetical protein B0H19DRAFT_1302918 [Mycena capillaripes]